MENFIKILIKYVNSIMFLDSKNPIFFLNLFICISFSSFSQTTITPIDGAVVANRYAIMTEASGNPYSLYQHIYKRSLINYSGTIQALQFEHNATAATTCTNMRIYLGETTKTSFSSTTDWVNTGLTLVYEGSITTTNDGFYTVNLQNTFTYTNTNNLILVVQRRNGTYTANASAMHRYETTGIDANVTLYNYSGSNLNDYGSWSSSGYTRQAALPSLKLVFQDPCQNSTSGGTIGNSQTGCQGGYDPTSLTSISLASSDQIGGLIEYKWQHSTTSAVAGFTDIVATNNSTYDPGTINQTTWYKRIARATCKTDWVGAVESNVIEITINCLNPTIGGSISNAQTICNGINPNILNSTSGASGTNCNIEYKWQQSTISAVSGFTDILGETAINYDPPVLTQTTWYKRIARATCKTDWVGAVESNVIEITVVPTTININGQPLSDTVYNQLGNASFGVGTNVTQGVNYQWQYSSNGGASWTNITNSSPFSNVNSSILHVSNPTYTYNNYLIRCYVYNSCTNTYSNAAILSVIPTSTFSNTTTTACGTNLNNDFSFQRNISVSGLPTTLGIANGQYVLKQVNIQLGTSSCTGNLSSYKARLVSPSGTIIELFNTFTSSTNSMWTNIKYRDHVALERVNQYVLSDQLNYQPHSIGYYAIQGDGDFFDVNGENPNGIWRLEIAENVATGNEVSFQRVDLIFGPKFTYTDITNSTANDNCLNPQCISTQEIIIGTNSGYSASEPAASFPGTTTDGCGWNGANNNSAWFNFVASATTAYITLSGIVNPTPGGNDTQPIIFSRSGDCNDMGTIDVPTGGCLDDVNDVSSVNLMDYHDSNGGGISNINNIYADGISMNAEFRLSGLTIGKTYYLYIDGNGGTPSSFYIEALSGCQTCYTPLPVEYINFYGNNKCELNSIYWITSSEIENDYFLIEESIDGVNFEEVARVKGSGYSVNPKDYKIDVYPKIRNHLYYYRINQVDFNGNKNLTKMISIENNCEVKKAFLNQNKLIVSGFDDIKEINIYDLSGRLIVKKNNVDEIDFQNSASSIYLIEIITNTSIFKTKIFKK